MQKTLRIKDVILKCSYHASRGQSIELGNRNLARNIDQLRLDLVFPGVFDLVEPVTARALIFAADRLIIVSPSPGQDTGAGLVVLRLIPVSLFLRCVPENLAVPVYLVPEMFARDLEWHNHRLASGRVQPALLRVLELQIDVGHVPDRNRYIGKRDSHLAAGAGAGTVVSCDSINATKAAAGITTV